MFTGLIKDEFTEYCVDPLKVKFELPPAELKVGVLVFVKSFTFGKTAFFHKLPDPG